MNIFNKHKTKWIPLGNYSFDGSDYIVFVRGNKKTGSMCFKVKKVHGMTYCTNSILPLSLIDTKKQWEIITDMLNK
jgi:hypothetical protein